MSHPILISILLGLAVLAVAAGCIGMLRMRGAAARLHFVSATALLAPPLVMAAVLCQEGLSQAGLKAILLALILLVQGPVAAHVLGRALYTRDHAKRQHHHTP